MSNSDHVVENSKVSVRYTGKFEDGEVFDTNVDCNKAPLQFTLGIDMVIPGFEKGLIGMVVGERKELTILPNDAYGICREDLILDVKKTDFPSHITPEVGQQLQMTRPDGNAVNVLITTIVDDLVTLNANHPLAGKTLIFDVEILTITIADKAMSEAKE